jgi:hypothetical protein
MIGRSRLVVAAATLLLTGVLTSGCASGRNALGTQSTPCFEELPTAAAAVEGRGHLIGVRIVSTTNFRAVDHLKKMVPVPADVRNVCLVAFSGSFRADTVKHPLRAPTNTSMPYAVVVVSSPENQLLGTLLVENPPLRFPHTLIGR